MDPPRVKKEVLNKTKGISTTSIDFNSRRAADYDGVAPYNDLDHFDIQKLIQTVLTKDGDGLLLWDKQVYTVHAGRHVLGRSAGRQFQALFNLSQVLCCMALNQQRVPTLRDIIVKLNSRTQRKDERDGRDISGITTRLRAKIHPKTNHKEDEDQKWNVVVLGTKLYTEGTLPVALSMLRNPVLIVVRKMLVQLLSVWLQVEQVALHILVHDPWVIRAFVHHLQENGGTAVNYSAAMGLDGLIGYMHHRRMLNHFKIFKEYDLVSRLEQILQHDSLRNPTKEGKSHADTILQVVGQSLICVQSYLREIYPEPNEFLPKESFDVPAVTSLRLHCFNAKCSALLMNTSQGERCRKCNIARYCSSKCDQTDTSHRCHGQQRELKSKFLPKGFLRTGTVSEETETEAKDALALRSLMVRIKNADLQFHNAFNEIKVNDTKKRGVMRSGAHKKQKAKLDQDMMSDNIGSEKPTVEQMRNTDTSTGCGDASVSNIDESNKQIPVCTEENMPNTPASNENPSPPAQAKYVPPQPHLDGDVINKSKQCISLATDRFLPKIPEEGDSFISETKSSLIPIKSTRSSPGVVTQNVNQRTKTEEAGKVRYLEEDPSQARSHQSQQDADLKQAYLEDKHSFQTIKHGLDTITSQVKLLKDSLEHNDRVCINDNNEELILTDKEENDLYHALPAPPPPSPRCCNKSAKLIRTWRTKQEDKKTLTQQQLQSKTQQDVHPCKKVASRIFQAFVLLAAVLLVLSLLVFAQVNFEYLEDLINKRIAFIYPPVQEVPMTHWWFI